MKTRTIRQSVSFAASPSELYTMFLSSAVHAAFTGAPARISGKIGGRFTVYDGYATGRNVALIPGKKIVQSWRASDWPEGVESLLTLTLTAARTGCRLTMVHSGVPSDQVDSIAQGWKDYYWTPIKELLKNR